MYHITLTIEGIYKSRYYAITENMLIAEKIIFDMLSDCDVNHFDYEVIECVNEMDRIWQHCTDGKGNSFNYQIQPISISSSIVDADWID